MNEKDRIERFYEGLPPLGNALAGRTSWTVTDLPEARLAVAELAARGVTGILPFLRCPGGLVGLSLAPGRSLEQAPCVLVYAGLAEAVTLGFHYTDWPAGLLVMEDWPARQRSPEMMADLDALAAATGESSATQLQALAGGQEQLAGLSRRNERIALGMQLIHPGPRGRLLHTLWSSRREPAAQACADFLQEQGREWLLPLRVFTAFLSYRDAPLALQEYAGEILTGQQLCDSTYSAVHYGNVPGGWTNRAEVLYARWLEKNDKLPADSPLAALSAALAGPEASCRGEAHARLASALTRDQPAAAWRLWQSAGIYAGDDRYLPDLINLCRQSDWPLLQAVLSMAVSTSA